MHKVKCMVTSRNKVVRDGVALIFGAAENMEIVGSTGFDAVEEAFKAQPDLLVYELSSEGNDDLMALTKIRDHCGWTKLILFSSVPLKNEALKQYLAICDGYLQGPLLPGVLLKALELACYSGYFLFLGFARDIKPKVKEGMQGLIQEGFSIKN